MAGNPNRIPFRLNTTDPNLIYDEARRKLDQRNFLEAFDLYEQISDNFPAYSTQVLSELFDVYKSFGMEDRYNSYQSRFFDFKIKPGDKVLDIGSGQAPFPFATHLAEFAVEDNHYGRAGVDFKNPSGLPVTICSVENMPFQDKEFDFVYCSHVLEHTDRPEDACRELMRVAKRGYIETPTKGKDIWLHTAKISNHHWTVDYWSDTVFFSNYSPLELDGLGSSVLMDMHIDPQSPREKAFSALIYLKAPIINTMVLWDNSFKFEVKRMGDKTEIERSIPSTSEIGKFEIKQLLG